MRGSGRRANPHYDLAQQLGSAPQVLERNALVVAVHPQFSVLAENRDPRNTFSIARYNGDVSELGSVEGCSVLAGRSIVTLGSSIIFRNRAKTSSCVSVGRRRPSSCASATFGITLTFVPALSIVAEIVVRSIA